jgi:hypothetical protein
MVLFRQRDSIGQIAGISRSITQAEKCVKNLRMDKSGREWPDFRSSDHELQT